VADTGALKSYAEQEANAYGIPPHILTGLITVESGWNPNAVGQSGEEGITQLMPGTAPNINRFDPYQSISFTAQLLRSYFDRFGSWDNALAAYNAGPNGDFNNPQTQGYIGKILGASDQKSTATAAGKPVNVNSLKILFWAAVAIVGIVLVRGVSGGGAT
jgi:soluble lytic murein transglycosylase-like protein